MKLNDKTKTCKDCLDPIRLNSDGVYVTSTAKDFTECITGSNHIPAPEFIPCEVCKTDIDWQTSQNNGDKYCEPCAKEIEKQHREELRDYWSAQ